MNDLYMGVHKIPGKKKDTFIDHAIDAKAMQRHLFVTGQSGSGKSSLVGRLIEEIILREVGNVLFLDCNYEFSQFAETNKKVFNEKYNRNNCPEDTYDEFKDAWDKKRPMIRTINATEVNILYENIDTYLKAPLLGIEQDKHPGAYWLLQMIEEHPILMDKITNKESLPKLINDIWRWFEGRAKETELQELSLIVHEMRRNLSTLDLTRFTNAAKSLANQEYVNFGPVTDKEFVDSNLVNSIFNSTVFCSIDLLNFPYEHYHFRDFAVLYMLHCTWKEAKTRFIERKIKGGVDLLPLFIVIDEAHNLSPSTSSSTQTPIAKEVARIVRTIAAEGRKFGLFLILISQRPDKIDDNVLSECDNFIIMKSTPPTIGRLAEYIGTKSDDQFMKSLEPAVFFEIGQAFYCGALSTDPDRLPFKVEGDIKRTK